MAFCSATRKPGFFWKLNNSSVLEATSKAWPVVTNTTTFVHSKGTHIGKNKKGVVPKNGPATETENDRLFFNVENTIEEEI